MNTSFSLVKCKYTQKTTSNATRKHMHAVIEMLFADQYKLVCILHYKISGINFALSEALICVGCFRSAFFLKGLNFIVATLRKYFL